MIKQKYFLKLFIVIAILSTSFFALVISHYDETDVSSGNCGAGHSRYMITLSTNYTGDSVIISEGGSFDLEVTASGQVTGDVWLGYAFWHTGSDNIQLPDTSPFIGEDNLVNEWNDGDDYYANFAWETVVSPMTRTFRISTTSVSGSETLTIQAAGEDSGAQERYSNVIAFSITFLDPNTPTVSITAPTNNDYVRGAAVPITATVDDGIGSGVKTVWAEITNATYNETVFLSGSEPSYSGTWDSTVVEDGPYTLTIKAEDNQSNINGTESIIINVDNIISGPQIIINSPNNADAGHEPPTFDVNIVDDLIDKTWYVIFDGSKWSEKIFFTGSSGSVNETIWNSLITGELIIRFYANNTLGVTSYEDVGFLKNVEDTGDDIIEALQFNQLQLIIISAVVGVNIGGGGIYVQVQAKKKRTTQRFKSRYESEYYDYYGKKPKKKKSINNNYK